MCGRTGVLDNRSALRRYARTSGLGLVRLCPHSTTSDIIPPAKCPTAVKCSPNPCSSCNSNGYTFRCPCPSQACDSPTSSLHLCRAAERLLCGALASAVLLPINCHYKLHRAVELHAVYELLQRPPRHCEQGHQQRQGHALHHPPTTCRGCSESAQTSSMFVHVVPNARPASHMPNTPGHCAHHETSVTHRRGAPL